MRLIKILHISPDSKLYGTERHILSILKYADKDRFEHWVAIPTEGILCEVLDYMGIRYSIAGRLHGYKHSYQGFFKSNGFYNLYELIKNEKYDIVHSHLNSYGIIASKLAGKSKNIHTRHGVFWTEEELQNVSYINRYIQKVKARCFDITIAIGEYERNTLINVFKYPPEKIRLTYNGVSVCEIESKVDWTLTKDKIFNTDGVVIGAVGRLEKQKGFHLLIKAARLVLDKIQDVKFVIIGNGSLHDQLIGLRNELGLQNNFEIMDYTPYIYSYMNCFDIMVQTSLWEGISYVVLEAMALQKPVIALTSPNTSGVKEIVVHGNTGYLIFEDYVDKLVDYILILSADKDSIRKMGVEGYRRVNELFSELRTAKDMEQVYSDIID